MRDTAHGRADEDIKEKQMMRKISSLLACVALVLALAAPAMAQSSTEDDYNGLAGAQQTGGGGGNVANATDTGGSLPFTGLQLVLIAGAGAGLLACGVAVRRASRFREGNA
jgi:hypothetical protein